MRSTVLFVVSSLVLVFVVVSPLPVIVYITPQPILEIRKVAVTTTTRALVNVTVGEAPSTGNETIGFVWENYPRNNVYYVRLTALDIYKDNTWFLGNYSLYEVRGLLLDYSNTTLESNNASTGSGDFANDFNATRALNIYFNITSLDLIPTIKPSIKIIPLPQPVLYNNLSNWTIVKLPRILVDNSSKFIAVRTLYLTNTTNYTVAVKWPTKFKPYPLISDYSLINRVLSVRVASILGPPANESSKRIQEFALLLRNEFYVKDLRSLLDYIISFLHSTTNYDPHPSPTPKNRDLVDYFLYTSFKGSCLHYATTLAVLLRDMGLRARVVLGYITKPYNDTYRIIRNPPHLWVEVFIPGYGWLQVDPTPPIASTEPSPTVLTGVEGSVTRYVSGEFKREVEASRRLNRLSPYEPVEVNGTRTNNTITAPASNNTKTLNNGTSNNWIWSQWITSGLIGLALVVYASIMIVNVYDGRRKRLRENEIKELLKEIALKRNLQLSVDYMTPREVVKGIIEHFPDTVKLELMRFLEAYEKARYGGKRELLNEAVRRLKNVYNMV